jgi:uncharacterized protein (TIGR02444 family)
MLHTFCVAVASKYNKYSVEPPAARVSLPQFAVAVHQADGVAAACVSLQDEFDLDVNILLLAAYVGAVRGQSLGAEQIAGARALVDAWHAEVVRSLRDVRRKLKAGPAPAPSERTEEVRSQVAKAELDAELVELAALDRWSSELEDASDTSSAAETIMAGMIAAIGSYSPDPITDDASRLLTKIAAAASRQAGAVS